MPYDPEQPYNPSDLNYWDIDVENLLEELEARLSALMSGTSGPQSVNSQPINQNPSEFEKGYHQGSIAELQSVIERIKANMYRPDRPNQSSLPPDGDDNDDSGEP